MKTVIGSSTAARAKNLEIDKPTGDHVSQRDLRVLAMVFKWKVVPLAMLKAQLMQDEKESTFEVRLFRLAERGLLKRIHHLGLVRMYTLTDSGFLRFRQGLDELKEEGFACENVAHDFFSMALQLGLWAEAKPANVEIVSEQEMRRFYLKQLPKWLPDIGGHRPDGFTRFTNPDGAKIVAFEVETSQKSSDRYGPVFQHYNSAEDVDLVIWLVKNKSLKSELARNILLVDESSLGKHGFIMLNDFKSCFWNAKVEIGQKPPLTLVELMSNLCRHDVGDLAKSCKKSSLLNFHRTVAKV